MLINFFEPFLITIGTILVVLFFSCILGAGVAVGQWAQGLITALLKTNSRDVTKS
jgi:hypothetical protein